MKKLILALCLGFALTSCSQSSEDKFVGTWQKDSNQKIEVVNEAGKYFVELGDNKYEAQSSDDLLAFDMPVYGKITLSIKNNNLIFDGYEYHKTK